MRVVGLSAIRQVLVFMSFLFYPMMVPKNKSSAKCAAKPRQEEQSVWVAPLGVVALSLGQLALLPLHDGAVCTFKTMFFCFLYCETEHP